MPRLKQPISGIEQLDRVEWAAGLSFQAYGLRIGIRTNNPVGLEHLAGRLPFGWKPARSTVVDRLYSIVISDAGGGSGESRFNLLYVGGEKLSEAMSLAEIINVLEIDLHSYVATSTRRRLFLHAGVVGWRGQAIVIPGKNFSGKTNLVLALLRAGAAFYSDEFAVLDSRGRVHPYLWALHLREEGLERPRACQIETLGARAGNKPLPVGLVVLSEYRPGAKWRPRSVSPGQAALAMLAHVLTTQAPEVTLPTLRQVVSGATVLKGARGEADEVVNSILNRIAH